MTSTGLFFAVQTQQQVNPLLNLLMPVSIMAIFYFLLIRPQQQKQKEHQKFVTALEKNVEVITEGGIHGTIVGVKDSTVTLRIADDVKIEIERSSILRKVK